MARLKLRDWRFLVLILAHVIGIAGFLSAGGGGGAVTAGTWRRIDTEAVKAKIRAGELSDHEADWYRPLDQETGGPPEGTQ